MISNVVCCSILDYPKHLPPLSHRSRSHSQPSKQPQNRHHPRSRAQKPSPQPLRRSPRRAPTGFARTTALRGAGLARAGRTSTATRGRRRLRVVRLPEGRQRRRRIDFPRAARHRGARGRRVRRRVRALLDARGHRALPHLAQVVEVRLHGGRGAGAGVAIRGRGGAGGIDFGAVGYQPVVVGLLDPLVDDAAGPGVCHLAVQGGLVVEGARADRVAARLGHEDGDAVVGRVGFEHVVPGGLVAAVAAPGVGVQREEVERLRGVAAAREVVLQHGAEGGNVGGGVADGDLAVVLCVAVGLHVAGGGLDVGRSDGAVARREHLVAHEEAGQVVVLLELVHDGGEGIALRRVPLGRDLLNLRVEGVQIQPDVDARVGEGAHALGVVLLGINVVDADRVGANGLHESGVEAALCGIDERVIGDELVGNAWYCQLLLLGRKKLSIPLT